MLRQQCQDHCAERSRRDARAEPAGPAKQPTRGRSHDADE